MLWGEKKEKWKASSCWELNPGHLWIELPVLCHLATTARWPPTLNWSKSLPLIAVFVAYSYIHGHSLEVFGGLHLLYLSLFPDTLHFGCTYHMHPSHPFFSTWGPVMLQKKKKHEQKLQHSNHANGCSQASLYQQLVSPSYVSVFKKLNRVTYRCRCVQPCVSGEWLSLMVGPLHSLYSALLHRVPSGC